MRGVIKLPASDTISARLINHRQEAEITPNKKCSDCAWFIVALNAPKSIVPSITACALNHVTTQAAHTVLPSGICCAPPICRTLLFNRLMPIYTTTSPPSSNMPSCTGGYFCITRPIPKKHASASVTSKKDNDKRRYKRPQARLRKRAVNNKQVLHADRSDVGEA